MKSTADTYARNAKVPAVFLLALPLGELSAKLTERVCFKEGIVKHFLAFDTSSNHACMVTSVLKGKALSTQKHKALIVLNNGRRKFSYK